MHLKCIVLVPIIEDGGKFKVSRFEKRSQLEHQPENYFPGDRLMRAKQECAIRECYRSLYCLWATSVQVNGDFYSVAQQLNSFIGLLDLNLADLANLPTNKDEVEEVFVVPWNFQVVELKVYELKYKVDHPSWFSCSLYKPIIKA